MTEEVVPRTGGSCHGQEQMGPESMRRSRSKIPAKLAVAQ